PDLMASGLERKSKPSGLLGIALAVRHEHLRHDDRTVTRRPRARLPYAGARDQAQPTWPLVRWPMRAADATTPSRGGTAGSYRELLETAVVRVHHARGRDGADRAAGPEGQEHRSSPGRVHEVSDQDRAGRRREAQPARRGAGADRTHAGRVDL